MLIIRKKSCNSSSEFFCLFFLFFLKKMQFRAARKASEEVGAQIVLGDRPIEITVSKIWVHEPDKKKSCSKFANDPCLF